MASYEYTHTIETDADPRDIWALYEDVATWPAWDAEAERVTRDGPFAAGSTGTTKFRGQPELTYTLTEVEPLREFVDETPVGDVVVRVSHRLDPLAGERLRVTYAAEIDGPAAAAEELGPLITGDFPATMDALIALAKERAS